MSVAPFTSDDKPDDFTMTILNHIDTATQDAIIWEYITFGVNLIKDASGNEFVKVVRCRDCKYYESVPEDSGDWCGYWTDRIYADVRGSGFCAWGERRGE